MFLRRGERKSAKRRRQSASVAAPARRTDQSGLLILSPHTPERGSKYILSDSLRSTDETRSQAAFTRRRARRRLPPSENEPFSRNKNCFSFFLARQIGGTARRQSTVRDGGTHPRVAFETKKRSPRICCARPRATRERERERERRISLPLLSLSYDAHATVEKGVSLEYRTRRIFATHGRAL